MKAYKGFNEKLQCTQNGKIYQYKIGETYEEPNANLCSDGFRACESPMDVFSYYSPSDGKFCEVELEDVSDKRGNDSKICGKKIHIGAEIGIKGIIEAGVKFVFDEVDWKSKETNTGYYSASTNTGDCSASTNTGDRSVSTSTGDRSASTNTGDRSVSTSTGDRSASTGTGDRSASASTGNRSASTSTGYFSASTNTGDYSASTNTGCCSASTNTGDCSASTNTGDCSASIVDGQNSVALAMGVRSKAKGALGCYIAVAEWEQKDDGCWELLDIQMRKVDGETIEANTFYFLKNGEFVPEDKPND